MIQKLAQLSLGFHMIAHDHRIAENTSSDYMETLFCDRAIVSDRERSYASVLPAIVSDHMETWLKPDHLSSCGFWKCALEKMSGCMHVKVGDFTDS